MSFEKKLHYPQTQAEFARMIGVSRGTGTIRPSNPVVVRR
jgi:hypothetical protein